MSDKKYQIFVSSTYLDLKEERQAVSKAILDLGHIPSGMELFPASSSSQIDYIKKVIDDCDYYVLIIGGRYGSLGADGISFTEQEYNYALHKNIPILAFIHGDVGDLKNKYTENDPDLRNRLEQFRLRAQGGRLTKYWINLGSLQADVITSLTSEFRDNARVGWRRDDGQLSREAQEKLAKLTENVEYYRKLYYKDNAKVQDYENLGTSEIEIRYTSSLGASRLVVSGEILIREFAPFIRNGLTMDEMYDGIHAIIEHRASQDAAEIEVSDVTIETVKMFFEVFEIAYEKDNVLFIKNDKKHLLKAAFKPLKQILDEIPF